MILYPILGIFSPEYRRMFKKAWVCAFKRITFKPCDISFGEELKNKILSKLVFKFPKTAKFIDRTATYWAFAFIALSVWSLIYVIIGGLNLWVYDTCDPQNGESCALSGEACGVNTDKSPSIIDTIGRIPDRFKTWNAKDYLPTPATYYKSYDSNKKDAIEFIDPGCKFCKKLWQNINQAGFEDKYNLTYVVYPIPQNGGYKFPHSYMLASYLEVLKTMPLESSSIPTDWRLLDKIFTDNTDKTDVQNAINSIWNKEQVISQIHKYLKEFGYNDEQIKTIDQKVENDDMKDVVLAHKDIVENKVKTIKIPTIIFDGRRWDRVVDVETLK